MYNKIYDFEEMKIRTISFYNEIGVKIPRKHLERAVQSLTMADYATKFSEKYKKQIKNHKALTTVGDAVCCAFLMIKKYQDNCVQKEMHDFKVSLENKELNINEKELLEDKVFAINTDIKEGNKKDYADAFEAIIGFISKYLSVKKAFDILEKYLVC